MAYLKLMKSAPNSAYAADDMTALMILGLFNSAILLGGNAVLFYRKNFPPGMLLDFVSLRILSVRLLHTTALTSVPCGGRIPN